MTTVRKLKEQEARAEELRKQAYEDTVIPADEGNPIDAALDPLANEAPDLVEENRKLSEALKALQGKYNAEVPRLTQQLRDTQQQLEQAKVAQTKAEDDAKQVNAKLEERIGRIRDELGEDVAEIMRDVAQQETPPPQQQQQLSNESDIDRFWRNLRRRVPDFDEVNISAEFIAWLQKPADNGLPRQQLLTEAGRDLDYVTVADIFAQYKTEKTKGSAAEDFASPPRGAKREPKQKKQYNTSDWVRLQDDIRKGRYRGREAEAAALEKEIHAAIHGY